MDHTNSTMTERENSNISQDTFQHENHDEKKKKKRKHKFELLLPGKESCNSNRLFVRRRKHEKNSFAFFFPNVFVSVLYFLKQLNSKCLFVVLFTVYLSYMSPRFRDSLFQFLCLSSISSQNNNLRWGRKENKKKERRERERGCGIEEREEEREGSKRQTRNKEKGKATKEEEEEEEEIE